VAHSPVDQTHGVTGLPIREQLSHEPLPPQAVEYYKQLLDRLNALVDGIRRSSFLLLIVAGSIELISGSAVSDVDLRPFKITDLSAVQRFLPLIAAFLIYDLVASGIRYLYTRRVAISIDREYRPKLQASTLSYLAFPPMPSLFGPVAHHRSRDLNRRMILFMRAGLRLGGITTPLILEFYWYFNLFNELGVNDFALWLSLVSSALPLLYVATALVCGARQGLER